MKKYVLEFDEEQAKVVAEALEFFSRFSAGQFMHWPPSFEASLWKTKPETADLDTQKRAVEAAFRNFKVAVMQLHPNESLGIGVPDLTEEAKIAYDIYRPILEEFAKETPEDSWNVYKTPSLSYSKKGRVDVKTKDEG